jgi:hypothetical protein
MADMFVLQYIKQLLDSAFSDFPDVPYLEIDDHEKMVVRSGNTKDNKEFINDLEKAFVHIVNELRLIEGQSKTN